MKQIFGASYALQMYIIKLDAFCKTKWRLILLVFCVDNSYYFYKNDCIPEGNDYFNPIVAFTYKTIMLEGSYPLVDYKVDKMEAMLKSKLVLQ